MLAIRVCSWPHKRIFVQHAVRFSVLVAGFSIPGCVSPPDISAFATATRSLALAVEGAGKTVHSELDAASLSDQAARFQSAWQARDRAMTAASDYADSLVAVVTAANSSGASARTLTQSLQSFAQVVGVLNPGASGATQLTTDTAAFLYAQFALVHAARTLDEAVSRADPIVHRLADFIVADTQDLESLIRSAAALRRIDLAREFNEPLSFRQSLASRQSELREKPYKSLAPDEISELERLANLLVTVETQLATFRVQSASLTVAETTQLAIIAQTREAIDDWAAAHSALALALKEHRPFSAESLVNATLELRDLIRRLQALP